jgi:hypothetical protein
VRRRGQAATLWAMLVYRGVCVGTASLAPPRCRIERRREGALRAHATAGEAAAGATQRPRLTRRRRPKWEAETTSRRRVDDFLKRLQPDDTGEVAAPKPAPGQVRRVLLLLSRSIPIHAETERRGGCVRSGTVPSERWRAALAVRRI